MLPPACLYLLPSGCVAGFEQKLLTYSNSIIALEGRLKERHVIAVRLIPQTQILLRDSPLSMVFSQTLHVCVSCVFEAECVRIPVMQHTYSLSKYILAIPRQ